MDYPDAGVKSRFTGALFDYIIIFIYMVFLTGLFMILQLEPLSFIPRTLFATPISGQISVICMLTIPVILYFSFCESSRFQQTFGKCKADLRVISTDGTKLGFPRALLRSVVKFIPWELAHTCMWRIRAEAPDSCDFSLLVTVGLILVWVLVITYVVSVIVSKKNQSLYDMIAGSLVVSAPCSKKTAA